ncbi:MAG: hypothetical protein MZV64_11455 [Ignavibacteriales bacterium]|nr:hypothetical protein [Ignavibacteriales bacterium]
MGRTATKLSLSFSGNYFAENVLGGDHGIQVRRRLRDVHGHHVRLLPGQPNPSLRRPGRPAPDRGMVGGLAPQGLHHQLRFQPLLRRSSRTP